MSDSGDGRLDTGTTAIAFAEPHTQLTMSSPTRSSGWTGSATIEFEIGGATCLWCVVGNKGPGNRGILHSENPPTSKPKLSGDWMMIRASCLTTSGRRRSPWTAVPWSQDRRKILKIGAGDGLVSAPRGARPGLGSSRARSSDGADWGRRLEHRIRNQSCSGRTATRLGSKVLVHPGKSQIAQPARELAPYSPEVVPSPPCAHLTSSFGPGRRRIGAPISHRRDVADPACQTMRCGPFKLHQAGRQS